jgi:hypothetical protein
LTTLLIFYLLSFCFYSIDWANIEAIEKYQKENK